MIYIFIAASYFPWLNLDQFVNDEVLASMKYAIWIMAVIGIAYQHIFHERYKMLETIFYLIIGVGPSLAIVRTVRNYFRMYEYMFHIIIETMYLISSEQLLQYSGT